MIKCACLIILNKLKNKILLVRVRDNKKWYLPGGKIEFNETPAQALIREIKEELGIDIKDSTLTYLTSIQADAYGINDTVELQCFTTDLKIKNYIPSAEISEIAFMDWNMDRIKFAPAVIDLCDTWLVNYIRSFSN